MGRHACTGLTPRQQEIVALVAAGMKNGEIAERLTITPETVSGHLKQIKRRVGVHTRGQVRALAGEYATESEVSDAAR